MLQPVLIDEKDDPRTVPQPSAAWAWDCCVWTQRALVAVGVVLFAVSLLEPAVTIDPFVNGAPPNSGLTALLFGIPWYPSNVLLALSPFIVLLLSRVTRPYAQIVVAFVSTLSTAWVLAVPALGPDKLHDGYFHWATAHCLMTCALYLPGWRTWLKPRSRPRRYPGFPVVTRQDLHSGPAAADPERKSRSEPAGSIIWDTDCLRALTSSRRLAVVTDHSVSVVWDLIWYSGRVICFAVLFVVVFEFFLGIAFSNRTGPHHDGLIVAGALAALWGSAGAVFLGFELPADRAGAVLTAAGTLITLVAGYWLVVDRVLLL